MDWSSIFLTLAGALGGTALSMFVPAHLERRQFKRRKEFFSVWQSAYQSLDHDSEWVEEEVLIDLELKGTSKNPNRYCNWENKE